MTITVTNLNGVIITEYGGEDGKAKEDELRADGFQTRLDQIKAEQEKSKNDRPNTQPLR